jgi:hypothetical protein
MRQSIHVITVVKDDLQGIIRTTMSLRKQSLNRDQFCMHVIDSSENHEIKAYLSTIGDLTIDYHYTEPKGVYRAMNTALEILAGQEIDSTDSIIFLNSGDFLINDHSLAILRADNLSHRMSACHAAMLDILKFPEIAYPATTTGDGQEYLNPLLFWLPHQGLMVNWQVFKDVGFFDERYKIAADYEWIVRAARINGPISITNNVLVAQGIGGLSNVKSYSGYKEREMIAVSLGMNRHRLQTNLIMKMYLKEIMFQYFPSLFSFFIKMKLTPVNYHHHLQDECPWCLYFSYKN